MQAALAKLPIYPATRSANDEAAVLKMTSREIAALTGKQHQHVKRDIERMLTELREDASNFGRTYTDGSNRSQIEYALDRELTDTLLTGYSAALRRAVVARWRELEAAAAPPPAELSRRDILLMALDAEERAAVAEKRVAVLQPQADALVRLSVAPMSMCQRDAAKHLQVKPMVFVNWLLDMGWTYRRTEHSRLVAMQDRIDAGHLSHKIVEIEGSVGMRQEPHVRVTPKGLARLACLISTGKGPK